MREIKFRVWDIKEKNWAEADSVRLLTSFKDESLTFVAGGIADEGVIFQQFTGLKDKNGKEIYEGDILKRDGGIEPTFLVEWVDEIACFQFKLLYGDKNTMYDVRLYRSEEEFEVIGNIYENPELIKKIEESQ